MPSAQAGAVVRGGTKQADAAEVQGAGTCAASGCFINFQVKSGSKFGFLLFFLTLKFVNFLFYSESHSPEQEESLANRPADKIDANKLV